MNAEDFIKSQICLTAYRDGHTEGINGMLAVSMVIRARQRAGWCGGDWIQLLSKHQDYAANITDYSPELPDPRNYIFGRLLQEIDGIFSGRRDDDILSPNQAFMGPITTFDGQPAKPVALYYGRLDDPNIREWFLDSISRNTDHHRQVASVGSLTFFS